jgi:hypothetical protein
MALGRGLSSLIPNRRVQDPADALEAIDSMVVVEETQETLAKEEPAQAEAASQSVGIPVFEEDDDDSVDEQESPVKNTFEDFSQLEGEPEMPIPQKPFVTPLELDPQEDSDLIDLAAQVSSAKQEQSVQEDVASPAVAEAVSQQEETVTADVVRQEEAETVSTWPCTRSAIRCRRSSRRVRSVLRDCRIGGRDSRSWLPVPSARCQVVED